MRPIRVASFALLLVSLTTALLVPPAVATRTPAPIRVVDAAGRTVELAQSPQRIVVIGRGPYMALDLLYLFPGVSRRLVGLETRGGSGSDFLPLVDSSFARKAGLTSPGPEQIAALHPDLVLMKANTAEATGATLAEVRVPIVYLGLETPEQFDRDVANLGTLLGQPGRAREITAYYHSRLARIRQGWRNVPEERRPRVLVAEYNERGGAAAVRVPARPWMQTIEVEAAGGRPVWLDSAEPTNGWTITNLEQIARWDPDAIVLVIWHTLDPARVLARLAADPQWRALRAVRTGRLHAFPADVYGWDTPDPRWLLGMTWMAKTLYPDRFRSLDVGREVHDFFATLYGMSDRAIADGIMSKVRTQ
ncbi:MAG TPA: ABC transporter substrate-binding protein, partial [Terriglobales bacterium]|nr:ABC transporter substrate-binding protein [Terriglobales bacterium]